MKFKPFMASLMVATMSLFLVACDDKTKPKPTPTPPPVQETPVDPTPVPTDPIPTEPTTPTPTDPTPTVPEPIEPTPVPSEPEPETPTPTPPPPEASNPNAPVARLTATRVTGVAPLAVLFDATGSTAPAVTMPFHDLSYEFDFGDNASGLWAISGKPRNTQEGGPIAAHVFDVPGTYNVKVQVRNAAGLSSEATVAITVQDPDVVFAGTNTICVSPSNTFTDCPSGAARQAGLPSVYGNKRVLLRRGETFGGVNIRREDDNVIVGAFGSGAKPVVSRVFLNSTRMGTNFADNITVMDLNVSDGIGHSDSGSKYLFYRNTLTRSGGNNSITFGDALEYMAEHNPSLPFYSPHEIFIVDNVITGQVNTTGTPFLNVGGLGAQIVLMGNDISRAQEHTVRLFALHKSFVGHNALRGHAHSGSGPSIRVTLKLHSLGLAPYTLDWPARGTKIATSQVVIADNLMGDAANNGSFTAGVAPQNRDVGTVEGIEDVIAENNRFIRGPYTNTEMENVGRRITTRGNTRVDGGPVNMSIGRPSPSLPAEWVGPYFQR